MASPTSPGMCRLPDAALPAHLSAARNQFDGPVACQLQVAFFHFEHILNL